MELSPADTTQVWREWGQEEDDCGKNFLKIFLLLSGGEPQNSCFQMQPFISCSPR